MEYKGLKLDEFQEQAIKAIENNHSVIVSAPTGSGKTLIADYIIERDLKKGIKVIYTAPIKALSNQKYKEFSKSYGEENIGLLTGDTVKNPGAPILIMTTEIYRNMVLTNDKMVHEISYVIFDEIHYINDIERGYVWEESIIFSKKQARFLCLSATIPNVHEFADWIRSIKDHKVEVIYHEQRPVPLHKVFYDSELGTTTLEEINEVIDIPSYKYLYGRSKKRRPYVNTPSHIELIKDIKENIPCFFFVFSRKSCQDNALALAKANLFKTNPEVTNYIRKKLSEVSPEIGNLKSTKILRQTLPAGIGFHHAGLLPVVKELVEELFSKGLMNVLYTTETFAVGINMPAKTVCFASLRKFDGASFRFIHSKEFFQIAGRAGRRGIDDEGFVYVIIDRREFNYKQIKRMTDVDLEPINSQFKLSINTVLNLIKRHNKHEINEILSKSFYSYQKHGKQHRLRKTVINNSFDNIQKKLIHLGYIKDDSLTEKGEFSSMIYADEITIGEIFATDFHTALNEYQVLMIIASLCYEARERSEHYKTYLSEFLIDLKRRIHSNHFLQRDKRFNALVDLTALIHPIYHGNSVFESIKNTNMLEGDVIRFFRQILDRVSQIRNATNDSSLIAKLDSCKTIVLDSMQNIDTI